MASIYKTNPGVKALLIFVIIILLLALFIVIFLSIRTAVDQFSVNGVYTGAACTVTAQGVVPDISSRPCCCSNGLFPSISKYVQEVNMISIPDAPSTASSVCSALCTSYTNGTCSGPNSGQYPSCYAAITPSGCLGVAQPVAFNNGVPYYGFQVGATCEATWDCVDITQCQ